MTDYEIIQMAKQRFDEELHTPQYAKIHADAGHLEKLLQLMDIRSGKHYLDIGTGNGYIAFELARRFHAIRITGLDIAENSIARNQQIARENAMNHVSFKTYEGMYLPFEDGCCYGVVSRYAFHHFPDARFAAYEIVRILESGGFMVLADPVAYDEDTVGFVDRFQALIPDGHVCFYKFAEIVRIFGEAGLATEEQFFNSITYPRELHAGYFRLFEKTPQEILDLYQIDIQEKQVFITVTVANTKFRKGGENYG